MRLIPSATRSRCTDAKVAYGLMAAARSGGRAVSAESSSCGAYSTRKPCHCLPHAFRASGNGNKRLAGNQKIEKNGLQTKQDIGTSSVSHSFFLYVKSPLLRNHMADGKPRSFKKIMCLSADRRNGSRQQASFRCRIHGRGFCHPTGYR